MPKIGETRQHNGGTYQFDGKQWTLVSEAQPAGSITVGRPDPYREPKEALQLKNLETQGRILGAKASEAEAKAAAQPSPEEAAKSAKVAAQSKLQDVENLLFNIQQARDNIGFWSMGLPGQLTKPLWGTPSANLAASLKGVASPGVIAKLGEMKAQSKTGASGFGALSERELALLEAAIASVSQAQSQEQLLDNLNRVEQHFRRFMAYNSGVDPTEPEGARWAGLAPEAEIPEGGNISGDVKAETDPQRAALNSTVLEMLKRGRSSDQVRTYLNQVQPGLGDRTTGLDEAEAWVRSGKPGEPTIDLERDLKPTEGLSRVIGAVGDSPAGAYFTGAADMLTGGTLDNLTENPEMTRAVMEASSRERPGSYFAGQLTGGAAAGSGISALAARYGLPALSGIGADALQGAIYGAGSADEEDDSRFGGAVGGALTGLAGGAAGRALVRGGAALTGGGRDLYSRYLADRGVEMTPGQILGGGAKAMEDKAMSLPVVGGQIRARRDEGLRTFNTAAFNEALDPIGARVGALGDEGVAAAQDLVNGTYRRALDGLSLQPDEPFVMSLQGADMANVRRINGVGDEIAGQIDELLETYGMGPRSYNPETGIDARNLQHVIQGLHTLRNGYRTNPQYGSRIAPRINQIIGSVEGLMERQAPDRYPLFQNANEAYKRVSILGDAVMNTGSQMDGLVSPAKLNQYARTSGIKFGGRNAARRGGIPFRDLTRAGSARLPSQLANSGTFDRAALPLLAGSLLGSGSYAGEDKEGRENLSDNITLALMGAGIAALPYSRAGSALSRRMFGSRPQSMRALADLMSRYTGAAGGAGAAWLNDRAAERVPNPKADIRVNDAAIRRAQLGGAGIPVPREEPEPSIDLGEDAIYDVETDTVVDPNTGERIRAYGGY